MDAKLRLRLCRYDLEASQGVNTADANVTDEPDSVRIGVQLGIFHSLTFPDQLPVTRIWLLGENLT